MSRSLVVAALVALAGCASTRVPNQLLEARIAYHRALSASGAALVSSDLRDARQALDAAERAFSEEGGRSALTKTLAYVAHRKAVAAHAQARQLQAERDKNAALAELERLAAAPSAASSVDREHKGELSIARQEAEARREARAKANAKVEGAVGRAFGRKAVETERGLVVTLPGSLLFASGKSTLLPEARKRLSEVAKVLEEDPRAIRVVGHTDAEGRPEANERLSEARANAVRSYLVSKGIEADRIRAEGMGETQPIADDASPEGRAENRRVEIVLEE